MGLTLEQRRARDAAVFKAKLAEAIRPENFTGQIPSWLTEKAINQNGGEKLLQSIGYPRGYGDFIYKAFLIPGIMGVEKATAGKSGRGARLAAVRDNLPAWFQGSFRSQVDDILRIEAKEEADRQAAAAERARLDQVRNTRRDDINARIRAYAEQSGKDFNYVKNALEKDLGYAIGTSNLAEDAAFKRASNTLDSVGKALVTNYKTELQRREDVKGVNLARGEALQNLAGRTDEQVTQQQDAQTAAAKGTYAAVNGVDNSAAQAALDQSLAAEHKANILKSAPAAVNALSNLIISVRGAGIKTPQELLNLLGKVRAGDATQQDFNIVSKWSSYAPADSRSLFTALTAMDEARAAGPTRDTYLGGSAEFQQRAQQHQQQYRGLADAVATQIDQYLQNHPNVNLAQTSQGLHSGTLDFAQLQDLAQRWGVSAPLPTPAGGAFMQPSVVSLGAGAPAVAQQVQQAVASAPPGSGFLAPAPAPAPAAASTQPAKPAPTLYTALGGSGPTKPDTSSSSSGGSGSSSIAGNFLSPTSTASTGSQSKRGHWS